MFVVCVQAIAKLQARVVDFLKTVHHRAVLFQSKSSGGDDGQVLFLSHSSPPLQLPELCDLLNALAQVDRGRFCGAVEQQIRSTKEKQRKLLQRQRATLEPAIGDLGLGIGSGTLLSDNMVAGCATGSVPAEVFIGGKRSILDQLYFSDGIVELVNEVIKAKLANANKKRSAGADAEAALSSSAGPADFIRRMQLWFYCLSDTRCPHGLPPRHSSVLSLWQTVSKVRTLLVAPATKPGLVVTRFGHLLVFPGSRVRRHRRDRRGRHHGPRRSKISIPRDVVLLDRHVSAHALLCLLCSPLCGRVTVCSVCVYAYLSILFRVQLPWLVEGLAPYDDYYLSQHVEPLLAGAVGESPSRLCIVLRVQSF